MKRSLLVSVSVLVTLCARSQNVGVGTASPSQRLDVSGWIRMGDETISGTGNAGTIRYHTAGKIQYHDGTSWHDLPGTVADDDWRKVGGGVPAVTDDIYHSAKVGIGTTAPSAMLDIVNAGTGGSGIVAAGEHLNISALAPNITLVDQSASVDNYALHLNQSVFTVGRYTGATAVTSDWVLKSGNVGIGTASPTQKLDVNGWANVVSGYKLDGTSVLFNTKNDVYGNIRVLQNNSSTIQDGMWINYNSPGTTNAHVRFFANGTAERMRIDASNGRVGIGTTSPGYLLHVNGTAGLGQTYLLNSDVYFTDAAHDHTGIGNCDGCAGIENANNFSTLMILGRDVSSGTGIDRRVSMYDKLSVGNNTFHNGATLSVNGSVRAKGGGASGNDSPRGYAFEDDGDTGMFAAGNSSPTFQRLSFYLNGNERLTIRDGKVGINENNPSYDLHLANNSAAKPTSNTWTVISDQRLKTLDGNYTKGLREILQLHPIRYHYTNHDSLQLPTEEECIGFFAQQVQQVFPEAVSTGKHGYLDFDIHPILVAYVNAFKEQQAMIDELRSALAAQKNTLNALHNQLKQPSGQTDPADETAASGRGK